MSDRSAEAAAATSLAVGAITRSVAAPLLATLLRRLRPPEGGGADAHVLLDVAVLTVLTSCTEAPEAPQERRYAVTPATSAAADEGEDASRPVTHRMVVSTAPPGARGGRGGEGGGGGWGEGGGEGGRGDGGGGLGGSGLGGGGLGGGGGGAVAGWAVGWEAEG